MQDNIAISVKNVSKTFRIPHEKVSSIRGAVVSVFNRNRGYEEFQALDDVSFEVKKGEFFGIIGRNGSGKSTLLKVLAGIYQADKGTIHIDGLISPFLELGIGFNPELSGRDNVYLNATVLGMTKKQIDAKFDAIVAFSELERFIDQKLKNYSSGMQVRLAFSVSIHANRDILLMDEVLAVGDSNFQSKCLTEFSKYRDAGRTVIIVTHDISVVQRYCDRAMLLRNGKIQMVGDPEAVGSKYIRQNMSDVDNLFSENDEKGSEKREKESRKRLGVESVHFLDHNDQPKIVFSSNERMVIWTKLQKDALEKARNDDAPLNVSVSIYDQERHYLLGINNIFDKFDARKILEKGEFKISFFHLPLNTGTYHVKILLAGETFSALYDEYYETMPFHVETEERSEGILSIKHEWSV